MRTLPLTYKTKRATKGLHGNVYKFPKKDAVLNQFGFNGQLKDNEIYGEGNAYTAEFWEYDPRSIRRWNRDPKPNISLSPYNCFAGNPIAFSDTRGDTLDIGNNAKSKSDIESIVKKENHQYLTFIDNRVGLDFGNLGNEERQKLLAEDEGLNLISDLIKSDKKILYEATEVAMYRNEAGQRDAMLLIDDPTGLINASERGLDSRNKRTHRPRLGYDGQVTIHPDAQFTEEDDRGTVIKKSRASIVFHELAENYERTHNNIDYKDRLFGTGAHTRASEREKKWHGRSAQPGRAELLPFAHPSQEERMRMNRIWFDYLDYK